MAEACFRSIVKNGPCGLPIPDDLIHQALRRANIIIKSAGGTLLTQADIDAAYPSPSAPHASRAHRPSVSSTVSAADSLAQSSLKLMTPVKSSASLTSMRCDNPLIGNPHSSQSAINSLRRVQRRQDKLQRSASAAFTHDGAWWPTLTPWSASPRTTAPPSPRREFSAAGSLSPGHITHKARSQSVVLTPQSRLPSSSSPPGRRRLPFEPTEAVASIDPQLAALELSSALTKHVTCSVCGADGVNFPNCRKCGLNFCSRPCRIDGAGNGKR